MRERYNILILEDDPLDADLISRELKGAGVNFSSRWVTTEAQFFEALSSEDPPDIILSDHNLPSFDGFKALRMTRQTHPEIPFIFVAAALGEQTVIEAFESGANDYVLKDHLTELVPAMERAKAQLKVEKTGAVQNLLEQMQSEALFFKTAVEQAKEAVIITTADLDLPGPEIIYTNEAFTNITGYEAEEVVGKTPRLLQGPKTQRKVLDRLRKQLAAGQSFSGETINYRKDGSEVLMQWEVSPIRSNAGVVTHFLSVQRDVTEQRQAIKAQTELAAENAARQKTEKTHGLIIRFLDQISDAFFTLDTQWRITLLNRRASEIVNIPQDQLLGKVIWEALPALVGTPFQVAYEKAFAENKQVTVEAFLETKKRWFENRIFPCEEGLCIFMLEVTDRHQQIEKLRLSDERFELVAQATHDVVYDWDLIGKKLHWNKNFQTVFRYDPTQVGDGIGEWEERVHPDDRKHVVDTLNAALESGNKNWQVQYRFFCGDGSCRHILDRGYIIRDGTGRPVRMVGAMMDVTQKAEAAAAVVESNRRVSNILESITDAFFAVDRSWRFTYVNSEAERLLEKKRSDLIGRNLWEEFPKSVHSTFHDEFLRAHQGNISVRFETYDARLERWLSVAAYPSADGLSVYFHDITEQKNAEEFSNSIIRNSPDCIKVLDLEGRLLTMSEGGRRLLEIDHLESYLGTYWPSWWINFRHLADAALADAQRGDVGRFQGYNPTVQGTPKWWDVICTPIRNEKGEPIKILSVARDISELMQARNEIQILNAELEHRVKIRTAELESANKELEAFSYSVSHDLRAPLRHIDGYLSLFKETAIAKLDEEEKQFLTTISEATTRMGLLIDDLLSFARMLRMDVVEVTFPFERVVREAIAAMEMEAKSRKIEWNIHDLPTVKGDPSMLRQVMVNLISNALKYSRKQEVTRIEISSRIEGDEIIIFVRDNGVGFDMNYVGKLFNVFQRLHRDHEFEGTGVGLANVQRIIQRHNGRVWAEGKLGEGATFYFSLPKP